MPSDKNKIANNTQNNININNKLLKTVDIKLIKISEQVLTLKFIYNISSGDGVNDNTREYITFAEFCKLCSEPKYANVILSLCDILGKIPFPFYWECAPIKQLTDPMKIYLVKAEFTTRAADITTFANQITAKNKDDYAVSFPSVTGSSELIIPNALKSDNATKFTHMRNFMKYTSNVGGKAGAKMRLAFWSVVVREAIQFLKKHGVVYLKTHGHGVNYFHFRLQKTNAYYVLNNFS
jgi:hypothetical protein